MKKISIHALREEGDITSQFFSSSSMQFLSTPSARRATRKQIVQYKDLDISIHALREEGDARSRFWTTRSKYFYPRPPRGGRRFLHSAGVKSFTFLSTPSARRATVCRMVFGHHVQISIHALREEGDSCTGCSTSAQRYFYPRPPRGGRPPADGDSSERPRYFYPRPPRGGRQFVKSFCHFFWHFYPRPPRGGRLFAPTMVM